MAKMKIIDGKFVKDGVIVPVEWGNMEQIQCLQYYQLLQEKINGVGIELNVDYEPLGFDATAIFRCQCGSSIQINREVDEEDQDDQLSGIKKKCKCGLKYITAMYKDELVIKIDK